MDCGRIVSRRSAEDGYQAVSAAEIEPIRYQRHAQDGAPESRRVRPVSASRICTSATTAIRYCWASPWRSIPASFVAVMATTAAARLLSLQSAGPDQARRQAGSRSGPGHPVRRRSHTWPPGGLCFQNPDHQLFADRSGPRPRSHPCNFQAFDAATEARVGELLARCGLGDRREDHPYRSATAKSAA